MAEQLDNLRRAHEVLARRVQRSLLTQLGDRQQLEAQREEVFRFLQAAEQHVHVFVPAEMADLRLSVNNMLSALDEARQQSSDPLEGPSLTVTQAVRTGRRGRPRIEIDRTFLGHALELRGPTHLAPVLGTSSRTVRRRAVDYGLAQPGPPVFQLVDQPDGSVARIHTSTSRPVSTLSDEELDRIVSGILEIFPSFGRRLLAGSLKSAGHNVPRERLVASYVRVHGTPGIFGDRQIHRRRYQVAGANALWHHDGQHALIRYKIVQHGFIDGASRLVVGIRAHDNNRADTVELLFHECREENGTPSRVRGDHGTENVGVARWMVEFRGAGRGSYIWGRSVHNTRIERLWFDVKRAYGQKWKDFFMLLEMHDDLNPDTPAHIWLLHHLFLSAINQDAQEWRKAWNDHKMDIQGERSRSPRDMFLFSMLQDGPRGLEVRTEPIHEQVEDISTYGIDWEEAEDPALMAHFLENNPQEWEEENPFQVGVPSTLSNVPCEAPDCPLSTEEIAFLDTSLANQVDLTSRNMDVRRVIWQTALRICSHIVNNRDAQI